MENNKSDKPLWVDFYAPTEQEKKPQPQPVISIDDFVKLQQQHIDQSSKYVSVVFTKGSYHFVNFSGKKEFKIRIGKTFATVPKPTIEKKNWKFIGWMCQDQLIDDSFEIIKPIILSPKFEKIK